jgi:hypothetical protein
MFLQLETFHRNPVPLFYWAALCICMESSWETEKRNQRAGENEEKPVGHRTALRLRPLAQTNPPGAKVSVRLVSVKVWPSSSRLTDLYADDNKTRPAVLVRMNETAINRPRFLISDTPPCDGDENWNNPPTVDESNQRL